MTLAEFKAQLRTCSECDIQFVIEHSEHVPPHAHVSEIGRVERVSIDCGGTLRKSVSAILQLWLADDTSHRMTTAKLLSIIHRSAPILNDDTLPVEIEYDDFIISQFPIRSSETEAGVLKFHLVSKHADCLAKDICLPCGPSRQNGCC